MTALPYPAQAGAPGVPADSTGVYPHLVGYAPLELGRRVLVAVVDGVIFLAVYALITALTLVGSAGTLTMAVAFVLSLGYLGAVLWALFAKSARLAGVFLGARYVDVRTGRPSGLALFLKSLLASLLGALTLGIAPLIMVFATIQQPLQRNWFDRALNLMLVDTRRGRNADDAAPALPVASAPEAQPGSSQRGAIQPVVLPGAPPAHTPYPAPSYPAPSFEAPSFQAPVGPLPPATPADVSPSPYDFGPSADFDGQSPTPGGSITPILDPGSVITSVPTGGGADPGASLVSPGLPPAAAPVAPVVVAPVSPPVLRALDSVDAAQADHTILAPFSVVREPGGPEAFLDDGSQLSLVPPTVLGRNPQAPGSHPDAVAHVVDDPLASKTHLLLGRDDEGPWVIDLHSTNGAAVAKVSGVEPARVEAGRKIRLPVGATVRFGRHTIGIR